MMQPKYRYKNLQLIKNSINKGICGPKETFNTFGIIVKEKTVRTLSRFKEIIIRDRSSLEAKVTLKLTDKTYPVWSIGDIIRVHRCYAKLYNNKLELIVPRPENVVIYPRANIDNPRSVANNPTFEPSNKLIVSALLRVDITSNVKNSPEYSTLSNLKPNGNDIEVICQLIGFQVLNDHKGCFAFVWDGTKCQIDNLKLYLPMEFDNPENKHKRDEALFKRARNLVHHLFIFDNVASVISNLEPGVFLHMTGVRISLLKRTHELYITCKGLVKALTGNNLDCIALRNRLAKVPEPTSDNEENASNCERQLEDQPGPSGVQLTPSTKKNCKAVQTENPATILTNTGLKFDKSTQITINDHLNQEPVNASPSTSPKRLLSRNETEQTILDQAKQKRIQDHLEEDIVFEHLTEEEEEEDVVLSNTNEEIPLLSHDVTKDTSLNNNDYSKIKWTSENTADDEEKDVNFIFNSAASESENQSEPPFDNTWLRSDGPIITQVRSLVPEFKVPRVPKQNNKRSIANAFFKPCSIIMERLPNQIFQVYSQTSASNTSEGNSTSPERTSSDDMSEAGSITSDTSTDVPNKPRQALSKRSSANNKKAERSTNATEVREPEAIASTSNNRPQTHTRRKRRDELYSLKNESAQNFGKNPHLMRSTVRRKQFANSLGGMYRPIKLSGEESSSSSFDGEPLRKRSKTSNKAMTSSSKTSNKPSTCSSKTSNKPSTSSSKTSNKPSTSSSKTSNKPSTSSSKTSNKPSTSSSKTSNKPSTSSSKTSNKPSTCSTKTSNKPSTSSSNKPKATISPLNRNSSNSSTGIELVENEPVLADTNKSPEVHVISSSSSCEISWSSVPKKKEWSVWTKKPSDLSIFSQFSLLSEATEAVTAIRDEENDIVSLPESLSEPIVDVDSNQEPLASMALGNDNTEPRPAMVSDQNKDSAETQNDAREVTELPSKIAQGVKSFNPSLIDRSLTISKP